MKTGKLVGYTGLALTTLLLAACDKGSRPDSLADNRKLKMECVRGLDANEKLLNTKIARADDDTLAGIKLFAIKNQNISHSDIIQLRKGNEEVSIGEMGTEFAVATSTINLSRSESSNESTASEIISINSINLNKSCADLKAELLVSATDATGLNVEINYGLLDIKEVTLDKIVLSGKEEDLRSSVQVTLEQINLEKLVSSNTVDEIKEKNGSVTKVSVKSLLTEESLLEVISIVSERELGEESLRALENHVLKLDGQDSGLLVNAKRQIEDNLSVGVSNQ